MGSGRPCRLPCHWDIVHRSRTAFMAADAPAVTFQTPVVRSRHSCRVSCERCILRTDFRSQPLFSKVQWLFSAGNRSRLCSHDGRCSARKSPGSPGNGEHLHARCKRVIDYLRAPSGLRLRCDPGLRECARKRKRPQFPRFYETSDSELFSNGQRPVVRSNAKTGIL